MTIIDQKRNLRNQMLLNRSKLDKTEKEKYDQLICKIVWEVICNNDFQNVHCYLPMGTEINIFPLIEKMLINNITVVTPKTLPNRKLQHLVLKSLNELERGVFGTSHPANSKEYSGPFDLIIVPGLAFNDSNFRLGYGGGYYDNFMVKHPKAYKLGIAYSFQNVEQIPLEPHDVQLNEILFA